MPTRDLNTFKNIPDRMLWKSSALEQIQQFEALAKRLQVKAEVVSDHFSKSIRLPVVKIEIGEIAFYLRNNFHDVNLCVISSQALELTPAQLLEGTQVPQNWDWYLNQIDRCRNYSWEHFTDEEMDDPTVLRVFKPYKDGMMESRVDAGRKDRWIVRMKSPEWYWTDWGNAKLFWEGEFGPGVLLWRQKLPYMEGISSIVPEEADQRYQKGCKMFSLALDTLDQAEAMIGRIVQHVTKTQNHYKETEMSPLFQTHRLNAAGFEKAKSIAKAFDDLKNALNLPAGRESSIVYTKLEEACFFAKKAMATQKENQDDE